MASIFDFLKRLFSRPSAPARAPAPAPERPRDTEPHAGPPPPPEAEQATPEPVAAVDEGQAENRAKEPAEEEADEEEEPDDLPAEEDFEDDDPSAPDPFVSPDAAPIEALSPDAVSQQRAEAMVLALTGEHRVFLAESAGPGTLAEALNLLAQQGKVEAAFHEGGEDGPYLLYRAIDPAGAPPQI